jgi:glycosyltransferase involved in cell wall biosynthesis
MDILFIGGVFTEEQQDEVLQKNRGVVQFAANTLQWNLIKGLDECNIRPVNILNAVFVGSYPRYYTDYYIKSYKWSHKPGAQDTNIAFLNIFGAKHIWRGIALANQAIKWAHCDSNEKKVIVVYSMHTPFIYAAAMAKRANPDIHVCLVVPDLPEFMDLSSNRNYLFNMLKKFDRLIMNKYLKYVDSFVLLTRHMVEPIGVGSRPWIVMEGVVNPEDLEEEDLQIEKSIKEKVILYTGTLNKKYGIMNLLRAFSMIEDRDYRLWICGAGEAESDIKAMAVQDSRVKFFGQLKRKEVLRLQRMATVLINPRGAEEEFTKYSFPSKTMEYLLSGTPTIVKRLPGIPEEYFNYLFTIDGDSDRDMAEKIIEVCSMPKAKLLEFGRKAREFVLKEKNHINQSKRILELVDAKEASLRRE